MEWMSLQSGKGSLLIRNSKVLVVKWTAVCIVFLMMECQSIHALLEHHFVLPDSWNTNDMEFNHANCSPDTFQAT
jgi:hypothetical protein